MSVACCQRVCQAVLKQSKRQKLLLLLLLLHHRRRETEEEVRGGATGPNNCCLIGSALSSVCVCRQPAYQPETTSLSGRRDGLLLFFILLLVDGLFILSTVLTDVLERPQLLAQYLLTGWLVVAG
ncbi:hypothetical protein CRUP_019166 [Coryphaenoides rupestris]|nr:hypothetical protein CRUP_019166 [Coryphaenoides rupestris]